MYRRGSFTPPTHQRYLSTYLPTYLPTQLGGKKGDLFLVVVWKGGEGENRHLPKKTVQIPRRFLARRLLEPFLTFTVLRCLHPQRHCPSPTPASHRIQSCE